MFELVIVYDRFQGTLEMHVRGGKTGRVAVSPEPSSATAARIADLHEGVGRAKQQLATVRNHFGQIEPQQIDSSDASAASEDFDNAWNALTSREQA